MDDLSTVVAMKFWVFSKLPLVFFSVGWISRRVISTKESCRRKRRVHIIRAFLEANHLRPGQLSELRDDLHSRRPVPDDTDGFVRVVILLVPVCTVALVAFKFFQTRNVGPSPGTTYDRESEEFSEHCIRNHNLLQNSLARDQDVGI